MLAKFGGKQTYGSSYISEVIVTFHQVERKFLVFVKHIWARLHESQNFFSHKQEKFFADPNFSNFTLFHIFTLYDLRIFTLQICLNQYERKGYSTILNLYVATRNMKLKNKTPKKVQTCARMKGLYPRALRSILRKSQIAQQTPVCQLTKSACVRRKMGADINNPVHFFPCLHEARGHPVLGIIVTVHQNCQA